MNTSPDTVRAGRLYALLPVVHRMRDADQGWPLKALMRVIAEQVNVVEDDIARLQSSTPFLLFEVSERGGRYIEQVLLRSGVGPFDRDAIG